MAKTFSKEKWLKSANQQVADGVLTQADVANALEQWVNEYDGKTEAEIGDNAPSNPDWYV